MARPFVTRKLQMTIRNSANDALGSAASLAQNALDPKPDRRYAVGISKGKGESLFVALAIVGPRTTYSQHIEVGSVGEVVPAVVGLARKVGIHSNDLAVFLNESTGDNDFRLKWVLVDPRTLTPRMVRGKRIESAYNN